MYNIYIMNQYEMPLIDAIKKHMDDNPTSLHIPGHKNGSGVNPILLDITGEEIFRMDLSEVHGMDDLHQPHGAIKQAEELAADAWGADYSFFLVNGTTAGIISSICTVVSEGDSIIIPRNAHKAAVFGLIASGATPIYVSPEIDYEKGLVGGLLPETLEKAFSSNPKAKAVFGINPSYHGICSDLKSLINITHSNDAIFIADEAHGSHVYFHENLPSGALALGADISCQSTHKMSGSLTQSSILHVKSNRIDMSKLKANLQLTQSTSPSYILMSSLDAARSFIATKGHSVFNELIPEIIKLRENLSEIPGIKVLGNDLIGSNGVFDYEPMRIVLSASKLGIEGYELYDILRNEYNIEPEYGDYYYSICVMGIGTKTEDLNNLLEAVKNIAKTYSRKELSSADEKLPEIPPMKITPREAWFSEQEVIPWDEAQGRISAQMITPYPPGIPAICPGEEITKDIHDYLDLLKENRRHMHGPENGILDSIRVVK